MAKTGKKKKATKKKTQASPPEKESPPPEDQEEPAEEPELSPEEEEALSALLAKLLGESAPNLCSSLEQCQPSGCGRKAGECAV